MNICVLHFWTESTTANFSQDFRIKRSPVCPLANIN